QAARPVHGRGPGGDPSRHTPSPGGGRSGPPRDQCHRHRRAERRRRDRGDDGRRRRDPPDRRAARRVHLQARKRRSRARGARGGGGNRRGRRGAGGGEGTGVASSPSALCSSLAAPCSTPAPVCWTRRAGRCRAPFALAAVAASFLAAFDCVNHSRGEARTSTVANRVVAGSPEGEDVIAVLILLLGQEAAARGDLQQLARYSPSMEVVVRLGSENWLTEPALRELRRWPVLPTLELRPPISPREARQLRKLKRFRARLAYGSAKDRSLRRLSPALASVRA